MHKFNHDFSCILAIFAVSLFTREWIEMLSSSPTFPEPDVSLFTREWIEIVFFSDAVAASEVSLFTREWIEIPRIADRSANIMSPSLRGSGLK